MPDINHVFFEGQVLWSQIDANQHMRHSAYADFGAQARIAMLETLGLKVSALFEYKVGPILFREELIYRREIGINERVRVTCELTKSRPNGSRWSVQHVFYRSDGVKAAIINVDGDWFDTEKRKLIALPAHLSELFMQTPRSADYREI